MNKSAIILVAAVAAGGCASMDSERSPAPAFVRSDAAPLTRAGFTNLERLDLGTLAAADPGASASTDPGAGDTGAPPTPDEPERDAGAADEASEADVQAAGLPPADVWEEDLPVAADVCEPDVAEDDATTAGAPENDVEQTDPGEHDAGEADASQAEDDLADDEGSVFPDSDRDGDGIPDGSDNCPDVANPDQRDGDLDGVGDACDTCPGHEDSHPGDLDGDGLGDGCDSDVDGDGVENDADCLPHVPGIHPGAADLCNGLDDDCDGETDEGYWEMGLGEPCDSDDADLCARGWLTCADDGLGVVCANEDLTDIVETCNGFDDDCNGLVDDRPGEPCWCGNGLCEPEYSEDEASCPDDCLLYCGDGGCWGEESPDSCPEDCPAGCGDGECDLAVECTTCRRDCATCQPDGVCDPGEVERCGGSVDCCRNPTGGGAGCKDDFCAGPACNEDPTTCALDCGFACGDKVCSPQEDAEICPEDCARVACGDGVCHYPRETASTCAFDCESPCGNIRCDANETYLDCPKDCPLCGDGLCSLMERYQGDAWCPRDCR